MEVSWALSLLLLILSLSILLKVFKPQTLKNLPPGPPKLPLIRNLHQLASKNTLPHRRLAELARVYGPIMHLQLGEVPTVVISSPEMAREVMKTQDAVFCDRPNVLIAEHLFYNSSDLALAPYGEYWRHVRKIATIELFTARRVQEFRPIREEEVLHLIKSLLPVAEAGSVINLTSKIFSISFDIFLRIAMNKKGEDGEEFRNIVKDMSAISSGFSVGDLYPSIGFISSVSGMKRKLQELVKRMNNMMDPIIKEHMCNKREGSSEEGEGDLVDILLNFHKEDSHPSHDFFLTTDNIKAIIFELFGAGGETISTLIDWAVSELFKNPKVMEKAQNEVRQVLQGDIIMANEASLNNLKYLKLVIKETLRLHPPFPCLVPRKSVERCRINSYEIPSNTRVFINAWAIGRDPHYWKNPETFNPERFEDSSIDFKGTHFELIPFGAGRRICPGIGLGLATVELVLAMLLYHFDWKLPHGGKPEDLDMDESFGITSRRKNDLQVVPVLSIFSGFK